MTAATVLASTLASMSLCIGTFPYAIDHGRASAATITVETPQAQTFETVAPPPAPTPPVHHCHKSNPGHYKEARVNEPVTPPPAPTDPRDPGCR